MNKTIPTLLFTLLCSIAAWSQVQQRYIFQQVQETYSPLTAGIELGTEDNDDQLFAEAFGAFIGPGLPIGFRFIYNGTPVDRFVVSANGWIGLGNGNFPVVQTYTILEEPQSAGFENAIGAFSADLQAQPGASLRYSTEGVAPNRVLVVQWSNYRKYNENGDNFNFQIRLYETRNTVEIIYGAMVNNGKDDVVQVGLRGTNNLDVVTLSTNADWSQAVAGGNNSARMPITTLCVPMTGQVFRWVSNVVLSSASHLSFRGNIIGNTVMLNWRMIGENAAESFVIEKSNNGIDFWPLQTIKSKSEKNATYSVIDPHPYPHYNFYRLLVQKNGQASLISSIVAVELQGEHIKPFSFFPNPSQGHFSIEVPPAYQNRPVTVTVLNALAKEVARFVLKNNQSLEQIDLRSLQEGFYVINILDKAGTIQTTKIIIRH